MCFDGSRSLNRWFAANDDYTAKALIAMALSTLKREHVPAWRTPMRRTGFDLPRSCGERPYRCASEKRDGCDVSSCGIPSRRGEYCIVGTAN